MKGNNMTLKIQKISSMTLIVVASILFVFSLGFMTNFYTLFFDGTSEMYELYKDIQILNNVIFDSALYLIVLAILQVPFDITKKVPSIYGLILALITLVLTLTNSMAVFRANTYFSDIYQGFDFTVLENYKVSMFPFNFTTFIFTTAVILAAIVFTTASLNYVVDRRKRV